MAAVLDRVTAEASMRPAQLTPENPPPEIEHTTCLFRFNEAGAINAGKLGECCDGGGKPCWLQ